MQVRARPAIHRGWPDLLGTNPAALVATVALVGAATGSAASDTAVSEPTPTFWIAWTQTLQAA